VTSLKMQQDFEEFGIFESKHTHIALTVQLRKTNDRANANTTVTFNGPKT